MLRPVFPRITLLRSLKIAPLAVFATLGLVSSASAVDRASGGRPVTGNDPGVITHEQMQAAQRQYQANLQARQGAAGPIQVQLLPIEGPCLGEPSSRSASSSATQAQLRRVNKQQLRQTNQYGSRPKSGKAIKPSNTNGR